MIMELLDAFGISTAGAPGFEADDVLGTLAARERNDPVVVVSGDRDLLQVVADEPVPVRVLYLGRGLAKATLFGPAEVAEHYGCRRIGPEPPTPNSRCCGATRPTACRACPVSARRRRPPCWLSTVRWTRSWPPPTTRDPSMAKGLRAKLLGSIDYIEAAGQVVRVATDAPVTLSRPTDVLPLVADDPKRTAELATELGVGSSIARLQKALDAY